MLQRSEPPEPGRPLTDDERRVTLDALLACDVAPAAICEAAVDEARLHRWAGWLGDVRGPRSLIAHVALASRADGIALGRAVYLRAPVYTRPGGLSKGLVAHEVCHVAQVLREGWPRFYARYGVYYARGIARGLGDRGAYLAIPYEVEARQVADVARGL